MTKKVYKTAQGKMVDLGALILKNENVRAVGNMNVNARGDLLDSLNRPVATRNQQVNKQYARQTTNNVTNDPVNVSRKRSDAQPSAPAPQAEIALDLEDINSQPEPKNTSADSGLAAAIAKARTIRPESQ